MKQYNSEKVIVTLTTHGVRLQHVSKTIFSILNGTFKDIHIVLTLSNKLLDKIPIDLKLMIDNNIIELLPVEKDLGPHTKYFYTMLKYKNVPIITIDDDGIYDKNTISNLYKTYLDNKNCVCANRVHKIRIKNKKIDLYKKWYYEYKNEEKPSNLLFATGVGGVLYPPDILNINETCIDEINKCKWADDIYLKVLEIRYNIKVVYTKTKYILPLPFKNEIRRITQDVGLYKKNIQSGNDKYIKIFAKDFEKIWIK